MKKAIVTGGAGFIGSHVVDLLVKRGFNVVILDDLTSGSLENIELVLKNKSAEFVEGSIMDLPLLQNIVKGADYVFHLAAIASVAESVKNPLHSHDVNSTGTLNLLIAARDNNSQKVILSSSSAIYGETNDLPKREEMSPNPMSPYAVSKLAAEQYCQVFNRLYRVPVVCLRYFNVYGPRQDPRSENAAVIPKFFDRIKRGAPIEIFGDGEQYRDFVFVSDVAEANLLAMDTKFNGVFNIGTGERTSLNVLATKMMEVSDKKVLVSHIESRPGDIRGSLADITRATSLGYKPKYNLKSGLKRSVIYFMQ